MESITAEGGQFSVSQAEKSVKGAILENQLDIKVCRMWVEIRRVEIIHIPLAPLSSHEVSKRNELLTNFYSFR